MKGFKLLAVFVFASTMAMAQNSDKPKLSPEQRAEKRTNKLAKELSLDDNQKRQMLDLNRKHMVAMSAKKQRMRALREEIKKSHQAHEENMKRIMTDEQRTKFDAKAEERKEKRRKKRCERMGCSG